MLHLWSFLVYICNTIAFSMKFQPKSDWLGVASASLCVVHCLLTPFLLLIASSFSWWHEVSYLFLLISFFAAFEASKHTESRIALRLIWLSFTLLTLCILFEDEFHFLHAMSYLASFGLIGGHLYNLHYCKKCTRD